MQALQRLIASGAKVQRKSETGSSALQCAAESGSFPVFSHLLQACILADLPHPHMLICFITLPIRQSRRILYRLLDVHIPGICDPHMVGCASSVPIQVSNLRRLRLHCCRC